MVLIRSNMGHCDHEVRLVDTSRVQWRGYWETGALSSSPILIPPLV